MVVALSVVAVLTVLLVLMTLCFTYSVINDHWRQHQPWYSGVQIQTVVSAFTPITAFIAAGIAYLAARTTWRVADEGRKLDRWKFEQQLAAERTRHDRELEAASTRITRQIDAEAEQARTQREADQAHQNEQRDRETRRELHARFNVASSQLAGNASMTRLAGVHAMSALADDWHAHDPNTGQIQVCVDVLCSYLRGPWNPEGDSAAEERTVRETIHAVLREHLQPEARPSWSDCALNLAGARLRDFDLNGAEVHRANFLWATFTGTTSFRGAKFTAAGTASPIDFRGATFSTADSLGIHFENAEFSAIESGRIDFLGATFRAHGRLDNILFDNAKFMAAGERSVISFSSAKFSATGWNAGIRFAGAEFTADSNGKIDLSSAQFTPSADESWISFASAKFFATAGGHISFTSAKFSAAEKSPAGEGVHGNRISFHGATFSATTTAKGQSEISFNRATFSAAGHESRVDFKTAGFSADGEDSRITLNHARFSAAEGSRIDFGGSSKLERATFEGTGRITFENPGQWVNVNVPWDDQQVPSVIRPRDWPPLSNESSKKSV